MTNFKQRQIKKIKMKRYLALFVALSFFAIDLSAQGFAWGVKGGPSMALQKWDQTERDPLFTYHGIAFIESLTDGEVALFAQAGYHNRGSAIITRGFTGVNPTTGMTQSFSGRTTKYQFTNAAVSVGAKQKFDFGSASKVYYMLGLRGEYTINTNLDEFEELVQFSPFYPFEGAVRKWNAGFIFGGGIEFPLSETIDIVAELTVNPDFTKQYYHPSLQNVLLPSFGGGGANVGTLPERSIRNNTIELSIGFRFIRQVEYVD